MALPEHDPQGAIPSLTQRPAPPAERETDPLAQQYARTALGSVLGAFGETPEEREDVRVAGLGGIPQGLGRLFREQTRRSLARAAEAADAGVRGASEVGTRIRHHLEGPMLGEARQLDPTAFADQPRINRPNLDRIAADPDVKRLIKNTYSQLEGKIVEHARIVTPRDETERLAYEALRSGRVTYERLLAMEPGTILNAHEGRAARILEVTAFEHGTDLAARVLRDEPLPPGEMRRAMAFLGEVAEKVYGATKAEPGRALGDLAVPVRSMKNYDVSIPFDRIRDLADSMDSRLSDRQIAEVVLRTLKDPEKVSYWARGMNKAPSLVIELMYGAMLSGQALVKNVLGNGLYAAVAVVDRAVESQMTRIARALGRDTAGWVQPGEATQMAIAYWETLIEQARLWKDLGGAALRRDAAGLTEAVDTIRAAGGRGPSKFDTVRPPAWTAENLGLDPNSTWGTAADIFGKVVRTGPTILQIEDSSWRAINGRMSMRATALRQAAEDGFQGPALYAEMERRMQNPTLKMLREVEYYQAENTFTKDFEFGSLGARAQQLQSHAVVQLGALPFFKTLVRIAEAGAVHTPGLNLITSQYRNALKQGGRVAVEAHAKLVTGAAFMGTGMWLESQGLLVGSGPTDPAMKKEWQRLGVLPHSFYNPFTEKYYSFQGLEPLSTFLSTAADVSRYLREGNNQNVGGFFWSATIAQIDNFISQPFALGLSHALEVVKSKDPDKWLNWLQDRMYQFYPAMLREVGKYTSDFRGERPRVQRDEQRGQIMVELRLLMERMLKDVPGWGGKAERDPITGKIELVPGADPITFMNPFKTKEKKSDLHVEVARLQKFGAFPTIPDFLQGRDPSQYRLEEVNERLGVRLNDDEKDRWQVLMTTMVLNGKNLEARLNELIKSDLYERMPDQRRSLAVWAVANAYKEAAHRKLVQEFGDLRAAMIEQRRIRQESVRLKPSAIQGMFQQ